MRETDKDKGRLSHMLEMALQLEIEKSKYTLDKIRNDKILFFGLSKMVEIIGEAAYMITNEFKEKHQDMPWRQMQGMRHILVHGYYTVDPEILWETIRHDIPPLIPILKAYIEEFDQKAR